LDDWEWGLGCLVYPRGLLAELALLWGFGEEQRKREDHKRKRKWETEDDEEDRIKELEDLEKERVRKLEEAERTTTAPLKMLDMLAGWRRSYADIGGWEAEQAPYLWSPHADIGGWSGASRSSATNLWWHPDADIWWMEAERIAAAAALEAEAAAESAAQGASAAASAAAAAVSAHSTARIAVEASIAAEEAGLVEERAAGEGTDSLAPLDVDMEEVEEGPPSPITAALRAAAKQQPAQPAEAPQPSPVQAVAPAPAVSLAAPPGPLAAPPKKPATAAGAEAKKKSGLKFGMGGASKKGKMAMFEVEEEIAPKRELITLDDDDDTPVAPRTKKERWGVDEKAKKEKEVVDMKTLIKMIPTSQEEIFAYPINWAKFDECDMWLNISKWVGKKVQELLGEEEPSLAEFIVTKVQTRMTATKLLEELSPVLDDDDDKQAEKFIVRLWRMLIFE
ncbi:hypothetical protein CYMTET_35939, partial [Cymbomonas tetramitiformis]